MVAILNPLTFPADLFPADDVLTSELATLTGPAEPRTTTAPWNTAPWHRSTATTERELPIEHPAVAGRAEAIERDRADLRLVHSATSVEPDVDGAVRPRPMAVAASSLGHVDDHVTAPTAGRRVRSLVGGVVLAVVVALAALGALALTGADAAASSPASSTTRVPSVAVDVAAASTPTDVVVRQGDTLWSIARRLHPSGDVRQLVDRLAERAGTTSLSVGQRIDVRGLID